MTLLEPLFAGLGQLRAHKLRSLLTLLGIVIGRGGPHYCGGVAWGGIAPRGDLAVRLQRWGGHDRGGAAAPVGAQGWPLGAPPLARVPD